MAVRRAISQNEGVYFITITCARWLTLFQDLNAYDVVYKWFDYLKSQGHFINAYVIMPNHLHAIIAFRHKDKTINSIVANGKRFMAYELVKKIKEQKADELLDLLASFVSTTEKKRKQLHKPFESSFDWKECITERFLIQKLDYIHNNPCRGKWNLVENPQDYAHSSARFYITDQQGNYSVTSVSELQDIDLTKDR